MCIVSSGIKPISGPPIASISQSPIDLPVTAGWHLVTLHFSTSALIYVELLVFSHLVDPPTMNKTDNRPTAPVGCPISALPNELISEIFIRCLPQAYPACPPLLGPNSPEMLLGICRLWRTVAIHTPLLWRAIERGPDNTARHVALVREWLRRSAESPLSIRLDLLTKFGTSEYLTQANEALFREVLQHRRRWQYVVLGIPPAQTALLSGSAPCLVEMRVTTNASQQDVVCVRDAHRLRLVSMWNVRYDAASLHWEDLTSLSLINTPYEECAPILRLATNLLCCALCVSSGSRTSDIRSGPFITHDRLEILILLCFGEPPRLHILDNFTLPALRKLEISGTEFPSVVDPVQSLLARSRCSLTHLRLVSSWRVLDWVVAECHRAFGGVVVTVAVSYDHRQDEERWLTEEYWEADNVRVKE
uniref:F-box domain-containing protein n=1 Tax=Mycena chlorophos TaxID=658473 RepID=A0ABQ0LPP0_MYCCL|nr:predicted protein [Mycena chlorophos]